MDKLQISDSVGTAVCAAEPGQTQVTDTKCSCEELQKKIESISAEFKDFVYIISHDLKGVLQYSRIGRVTENRVEIKLNELVPEIIETLNAPPGIHITIENQLPVVVSEPTRIRQVFENLLSNAVRFMGKTDGSVKVGCTEEDRFWKFSVSDTGPGIDQQHFEKIFRLFQTLQAKDQFESTGVGLTIAKKIVELYGGKIWLTSKVGQGSTFYFTLPK
jgi:two-component system sensor kinase FixL